MRERSITIAILLIAATAVLGELSPGVYEELQRKAPEVLYIQVASVDVRRSVAKPSDCSFFDFEVIRDVKVQARVVRVVRSQTGSAAVPAGTGRDRSRCCGRAIEPTHFSRDADVRPF